MKLQVQVGAAADASFNNVFRSVTDAATAANRKIGAEDKNQARLHEALLKDRWAKQKLILQQQISEEKAVHNHLRQLELARLRQSVQGTRSTAKQNRDVIVSEATKTSKELERLQRKDISDARRMGRQKAQAQMAAEREFARTQEKSARDIPYRMGYWASRNFSPITPMLSYAGRAASQMMRGAGIQLDVGSMVGNTVANQKTVTDIVNSGYIPGAAGATGTRQDPAKVMADVKEAANAAALDYGQGLEGLQKYTAKTGDLETGRKILKDMAVYARATGTSFEDMVDAAGDVGNALGNVADKDQKIKSVMLAIAGMGKVGAVEIKDLAKQMAKIGAASGQFGGGAAKNMITLTAMAQEARATGGAASATQAATSVLSFVNSITKSARVAAYQKVTGRKLFNADQSIVGPEEYLLESLKATKGNKLAMGGIIADAGARRISRGFETIYNKAGGAKMVDFNASTMPGLQGMAEKDKNGVYKVQAGLVAVVAEFKRLKDATMTQADAEEAFKESMKTTEAKVKLFNNAMQDTADKMAEKIFPQMEKIQPAAIRVVEAFGGIAAWLAENPFAIIPALLSAAILKAGIEQSIRVGIENVFRTAAGNAGAGLGGGMGVMGNVAAGFVIASMAVAALTVGMATIDSWFTKEQTGQKKDVETEIGAGNTESLLKQEIKASDAAAATSTTGMTEQEKARHDLESKKVKQSVLDKAKKDVENLQSQADENQKGPGIGTQLLRFLATSVGVLHHSETEKEDKAKADHAAKQLEQAEKLNKLIAQGTLRVEVTNMPTDGPAPKVHEGGRTPSAPAPGN